MGSSSTIFCLGTSSWNWARKALGNFLARDGTEELALLAALGRELDGHVLELAAHFDGGLTVRGLLGAAGLFLQVHGVDGVSRGEHGELAGQQEVSCIALGCVDELALFALTSHVLR